MRERERRRGETAAQRERQRPGEKATWRASRGERAVRRAVRTGRDLHRGRDSSAEGETCAKGGAYLERPAQRERQTCAKGATATGRESDVEGGAGGESCAKGGAYRERAAQTAAQRAVVHELLLHDLHRMVHQVLSRMLYNSVGHSWGRDDTLNDGGLLCPFNWLDLQPTNH